MPNLFKRRPSAGSSPSTSKGLGSIGKNAKAGSTPHGIRIAANSGADALSEGQQSRQLSDQRLDPTNLLPPESNYRTSLIMPHLTKRFTLLRAPDGTMVTPEAMRAHLRAQRARARATGVPGTQCFLTEEEEDEIIDQLRRQTRMEEMEEWEASVQQQQQQQHSQQQQQIDQMQFGGTDGFGTWSTPYQGHQRSDSKIDESITESFSNLRDSTSNSARSNDEHGATGRLFSSSSSNRDFAYMKEVEKSRAAKKTEDDYSFDQESRKDENEQKFTPVLQEIQDEESDAELTSRGESVTPIGAHPSEILIESSEDTPGEDAMPGDFLVASHRESKRLSAPQRNESTDNVQEVDNSFLTPNASARPQRHRHSELLTTLTPEAFNRVSMALEEVYEMVSGRVEESEEEGEEDDLEDHERSGATLLAYDSESGPSYEDDKLSEEERESLEDTRQPKRRSFESETNSFTSARSEVAASAFEGHGALNRTEALSGIGNAAAAFTSISPDDRAISPSAPAGWSVSQPIGQNHRATFGDPRRGQSTRHVAGKSSMGSSSAASVASQQSNRLDSPSLRRPLHTPPFDALPSSARSFNGSSSSPLVSNLPSSSGMESATISPLAAGFHLAGNQNGQTEAGTKAASAAAAAAATAAGVAASNYVAQAQQQQRENTSNRISGQMNTSDSSATIVPTSEITVAYPQSDQSNREILVEQHDEQPIERLSQANSPTELVNVPATQSPLRPSAAENQVLSANAIAARSPKYFPTATNRSMHSYATGFRTAAPATTDNVQSSPNQSEEVDKSQSTSGFVNQAQGSSTDPASRIFSGKGKGDDPKISPVPSAKSLNGATLEIEPAKKPNHLDAIQTDTLQSSANLPSLSPVPPSDPEEASKWRKQYGIEKSFDAGSVKSGISLQISEDEPLRDERLEDQDDIEDDVWARVARNTSPNLDSNSVIHANKTSDSRIAGNVSRSSDVQPYSASAKSAGIGSSPDALTEKSGLSMDELHKIQNDLVRSANAKQNADFNTQESAAKLEKAREKARMISADRSMNSNGTHPDSRNTSMDTNKREIESIRSLTENRVHSDEVTGKSVDLQKEAEKRSSQPTGNISQQNGNTPSSVPLKSPDPKDSSNLQREVSSRSFRSQVMYDVTSSHRPTSPPPRTHKTSLSNLPTLQDLSLGVAPMRTTASGVPDRNSTSLISMMETSARVHDQLSASDAQPGNKGIQGAIVEEEAGPEEFEDVAIEDGFGGFTWERRKRLPRSQSHDVLSSGRLHNFDDTQEEAKQPSQFSPKSFRSESGAEREDGANENGDASWSRLPGEEPFVSPNLIDDVAAQARAATHALKGQYGERPKMRSKSLGKVRKNLSKAISQPQLVSTTQRMEHTQGLSHVDDTLRKTDTNKRPPFPQEMRSSSLTPASSPVVKSTTPTLQQQQQQAQRKVSPRQPPIIQNNIVTSTDAIKEGNRELQAQSPPSPLDTKRLRSGSANTLQSRSVSPTDYKTNAPTDYKAQTVSARKISSASGHIRRSSSFGHRIQLDGSISPSTQISPARSGSINFKSTNSSTANSPQGERGQTGLSRLLTRFRGKKLSDLPAVIEPYPSDGQSSSAARSSPALSNVTTPIPTSSPVFRTPKESPGQGQISPSKADTFAGRLEMSNQSGYSSLADMFSPTTDGQSFNQNGKILATQESTIPGSRSQSGHTSSALAPAAPIHARLARGTSAVEGVPLPRVESSNMSKRRSARETIVRRTIIVSTYDPGVEDRRKSVSAAQKGSLRKSTSIQSPQQQNTTNPTLSSQHHRRTSSTTSSKARRSIQDRPPTPPGPDGVSGTHRRKLSQEVKAKPLPPTAKNVYEAPTQTPNIPNSSSLGIPQSASRSNTGSASRASNVSGYGASLYDLYDRDDDDDSSVTMQNAQNRSSGLAPPHGTSNMSRQTSEGTNTGARHIEVTERADGSVVWQVIAGLADRSSVYTASIGYGGGHSRQNSDTSQYSFMRNPPKDGTFNLSSPMGRPNALADEDGRSLFARTPTKKSFSIHEDGNVPPLPNMNDINQSVDTATASQQAQQLDFEMATTTAGQAATRIVYTSDAELAVLLESLAGPDKSSAKFAFQRVYEQESDHAEGKETAENGSESQDTAFASIPSTSSRQNVLSLGQDGSVNGVTTSPRQSQKSGRPVSIWTESELTNDPTGALRSQRFKIEAEIYSLLQRETAMSASPPFNEIQHSPGGNFKNKNVQSQR